jgi:DNA processing protein
VSQTAAPDFWAELSREPALAWVALDRLSGLSRESVRRLLARHQTPQRALACSASEVAAACGARAAAGFAPRLDGAALRSLSAALRRCGAQVVPCADAAFPVLLREIPDPPTLLFVQGALPPEPRLAIVGARRASARGREVARALAAAVTRAGVAVVSGLAYGIDAAAHEGALAAGGSSTIVLASGIDRPSPRGNVALARRSLRAGGAWISEHGPGEPPFAYRFPERNRLISGLARATLVVEAQEASGSLWTARHALEQGRDVLVVPGPVDTELCRGSNRLLREGAAPILDAQDLLHALGLPHAARAAASESPRPALAGLAGRIWQRLGAGPCDADALARELRIDAARLARTLVELELEGHLVRTGQRISRVGHASGAWVAAGRAAGPHEES